jgi:dihydroxy-acid dehydratase
MSVLKFTGPARCFDCEEDAFESVNKKTYKEGDVIVIRYEDRWPRYARNASDHGGADRSGHGRQGGSHHRRTFSGATRGCVGHVGPEAAVGGPIGLIRDGDIIELDAVNGTLSVKLTDAELAERRKAWKPRDTAVGSGVLWKYAQQVGPAVKGAVTHPGGAAEKVCYADI